MQYSIFNIRNNNKTFNEKGKNAPDLIMETLVGIVMGLSISCIKQPFMPFVTFSVPGLIGRWIIRVTSMLLA
jgi:hypothetical protein